MFDTSNFHETDPGYAIIFISESNGAFSNRSWDGATRDSNCAHQRLFKGIYYCYWIKEMRREGKGER
jgi:hypothetical protein